MSIEDDEVIDVRMPRSDYKIMREMIADRKSTNYVMRRVKNFSLWLSGVIAAWFFLGDKIITLMKKLLV